MPSGVPRRMAIGMETSSIANVCAMATQISGASSMMRSKLKAAALPLLVASTSEVKFIGNPGSLYAGQFDSQGWGRLGAPVQRDFVADQVAADWRRWLKAWFVQRAQRELFDYCTVFHDGDLVRNGLDDVHFMGDDD